MECEQKWQSRVLCLTRLSDKSIFLALRVTAGWSTGRQRDATAVWKYTDVAGFSVAEIWCVCVYACVHVCMGACFAAVRIEVNMHATILDVCFMMLHEILFLSRFVCAERWSVCARVFLSCVWLMCSCVFLCASQELGWAHCSCSNVKFSSFLPPLSSPLLCSPLLNS